MAPDSTTKDLSAPVVALAQTLGRQVVVWTPDTTQQVAAAISIGVDGVITNRPDVALALR